MIRRPLPAVLLSAAMSLALLLAGCDSPEPVPDEGVPDPQAQAAPADEATGLRDAIQEPIDKAKDVETEEAAREAERQQALDAAGG